jgi:hypothetical protein
MHIKADEMTTEELEAYDGMMVEVVIKVQILAGLAMAVWADVLRELDKRGRVKLLSGSYDNVGEALVQRSR